MLSFIDVETEAAIRAEQECLQQIEVELKIVHAVLQQSAEELPRFVAEVARADLEARSVVEGAGGVAARVRFESVRSKP